MSRGRKVAYSLLLLFMLVGAAEIVGQMLYAGRTRTNLYMRQSYYKNREWSREVLTTIHRGQKMRYEPFVGWRRPDCASKYVNVVDGERVTIHPREPSPSAVNIWCLGGSTTWGHGVRDGYTMPSHLARIAQDAGYDVRVRNLGESGWVSNQEAIYLALLVRRGEMADIAVFYDGINDVFAAYQSGLTNGQPQNLDLFENLFDRGYDPRRRFYNKIAIVRAMKKFARAVSDPWQSPIGSGGDVAAAELVASYAQTVDHVRRISASYGFEAMFFWQPAICFQPDYRETERDAYKRSHNKKVEGMLEFYKIATEKARGVDVVDLSLCLGASPPEGYFIDHNHLTEEGNAVAAGAIFEHLRPLLDRRLTEGGEGK